MDLSITGYVYDLITQTLGHRLKKLNDNLDAALDSFGSMQNAGKHKVAQKLVGQSSTAEQRKLVKGKMKVQGSLKQDTRPLHNRGQPVLQDNEEARSRVPWKVEASSHWWSCCQRSPRYTTTS